MTGRLNLWWGTWHTVSPGPFHPATAVTWGWKPTSVLTGSLHAAQEPALAFTAPPADEEHDIFPASFYFEKKESTQLPLPVLKIFHSCLILRNVQQGLQKWITSSDGEIKPSSFRGKRIISLMETQQLPTAGWRTWEEHRRWLKKACFLQICLFSFLFFYFRHTLSLVFISFGRDGFGKQFSRQVPQSCDSKHRKKEEKTYELNQASGYNQQHLQQQQQLDAAVSAAFQKDRKDSRCHKSWHLSARLSPSQAVVQPFLPNALQNANALVTVLCHNRGWKGRCKCKSSHSSNI